MRLGMRLGMGRWGRGQVAGDGFSYLAHLLVVLLQLLEIDGLQVLHVLLLCLLLAGMVVLVVSKQTVATTSIATGGHHLVLAEHGVHLVDLVLAHLAELLLELLVLVVLGVHDEALGVHGQVLLLREGELLASVALEYILLRCGAIPFRLMCLTDLQ
jgi:hypothetical protein